MWKDDHKNKTIKMTTTTTTTTTTTVLNYHSSNNVYAVHKIERSVISVACIGLKKMRDLTFKIFSSDPVGFAGRRGK